MIQVKEAHQPRDRRDGVRVLIERRWPRSLKKSEAGISLWLRALAPSPKLRRWTLGKAGPAPGKHLLLLRSAASTRLQGKPLTKNPGPASRAASPASNWLRAQLFRRKYFGELAQPEAAAALQQLHCLAEGKRRLTLVYSAPASSRNLSAAGGAPQSSSSSSAKKLSPGNSARSAATRTRSTGTTAAVRKTAEESSEFACHATALKQLLEGLPKPPGRSGPEKAAARGRNQAAMR